MVLRVIVMVMLLWLLPVVQVLIFMNGAQVTAILLFQAFVLVITLYPFGILTDLIL
ncbi:hypothetical protein D3C86_1202220 [compost metagenome]